SITWAAPIIGAAPASRRPASFSISSTTAIGGSGCRTATCARTPASRGTTRSSSGGSTTRPRRTAAFGAPTGRTSIASSGPTRTATRTTVSTTRWRASRCWNATSPIARRATASWSTTRRASSVLRRARASAQLVEFRQHRHRLFRSFDDAAAGGGERPELCLGAFAGAADQRAGVTHLLFLRRVTADHHGVDRFWEAARGLREGIFLVAADLAAEQHRRSRLVLGQRLQ